MPRVGETSGGGVPLKIPQVRVMRALAGGAVLTRAKLQERAGYTAASGTVTRVLNGLREGSSSGAAHPGLLALGLVERVDLDVDGVTECGYALTAAGEARLAALNGTPLPKHRDRWKSTNYRYQG